MALALAPAASARPADLRKVDSSLHHTIALHSGHAKRQVGGISVAPLPVTASGKVLVDVYVHGSLRANAARLRNRGMRVDAQTSRAPQPIVEGWLPLDRIDDVAALASTKAVVAVQGGFTNTGTVLSQGDAAHRGPQARAFGPTGQGVPVGIMSDSINRVGSGVAGSQATGNLPPNVQIIQDGATGNDEGRAMAEIVFDTAPGIPKILFATGTGGPVNRANNIDALVANGAKVIADDTVFLTEPFFQDGVVAQAADRAKVNGVPYFVSAGNRARQSWEGTFIPSANPNQSENDFDPGVGEDRRQTIVQLPAGSVADPTRLTFVLDWAEPVNAVQTDLDLDFYDLPDENTPVATFDSDNIATGLPIEAGTIQNTGAATFVSVRINRFAGSATPALKWIANTNFGPFTPAEHNTNSAAIDPDAASARGALTVAAVNQGDPGHDTPESFSSRGPSVTRYFNAAGTPIAPDVRLKPDIAAADGVSTSVTGFAPFFGTSAAAPSAAGVGALLLSAYPSMTVDQLYAAMRNGTGAADCTAPGLPDPDCGFGFIFADSKMFALDTTGPTVTPVLSPAAPDGANGWYRQNVGLTWSVSDDRSPASAGANCVPASITTDSVITLTCTGTSSGGTTNQPVTIKRDTSPPTAPAFTGITTGTFNAKRLPSAARVRCVATDPTSGVDSCVISGFSRRPGRHTLTATATNDAGLQSQSKLRYTVRPYAVRSVRVPRRISLAALRAGGLPVRFQARAKGTATLALERRGRRVARDRTRFRRGANSTRLRARRAGVLTLVLRATSPSASTVTLRRTVRVVP